MARCVGHTSCDRCGSRDNKALYDDGSSWCFGCRQFSPPSYLASRRSITPSSMRVNTDDWDYTIPPQAKQWLKQYGLTESECSDYIWSDSMGLGYPLRDDNGVVGCVYRGIGKGFKYRVIGDKKAVRFSKGSDTLVFTEDVVSAIKVGRHIDTCALLGCNLPLAFLQDVRYKKFILWLDPDKRSDAIRQVNHFKSLGYNITALFSSVDPKELSDRDILNSLERGTKVPT